MKLINANLVVHWEAYDDEHESFTRHSGTIAEFLDQMTDEGCPETVDAVTVRHGRWERHYCEDDGISDGWRCSACSEWYFFDHTPNFCPNCGAKMDGKDGEHDRG